jgi:hypothetical protein
MLGIRESRRPSRGVRALARDAHGAVFVEKLIVYLPLLVTFFAAWELAEFASAQMVVQRACAAAGRAAIVVLPDDPSFYDGEPMHDFSGLRQEEIELAAGMILSVIPRFSDDFVVAIDNVPSSGQGSIDVTVEASYDCGAASLICGGGGTAVLTSTTTHAYHGAKYQYTMLAMGGTSTPLTNTDAGGEFRARNNGGGGGGSGSGSGSGSGGGGGGGNCPVDTPCATLASASFTKIPVTPPPYQKCKKLSDAEIDQATAGIPPQSDPKQGKQLNTTNPGRDNSFGNEPTSDAVLEYRCTQATPVKASKNVAIVIFRCQKPGEAPWTDSAVAESIDSDPKNWQHSEQVAVAKYEQMAKAKGYDIKQHCKPLSLYTERDSCFNSGGPSCNDWFAKGGLGQTKTPHLETPPSDIINLGKNVSWHFEYNNNYKKFDYERCGVKAAKAHMNKEGKALCKKLEDGEKACKAVGVTWGAGDPRVKCKGADKAITWRPNQTADRDRQKKQYDADMKAWNKQKDAYAAWKRYEADPKKNRKPWGSRACKPGPRPKPPFDDKALEQTPKNIANAEKCLEALSTIESLQQDIKGPARDIIAETMKAKCNDIRKKKGMKPLPANYNY